MTFQCLENQVQILTMPHVALMSQPLPILADFGAILLTMLFLGP